MTRAELLKIAKPILFNTEMVRAILDGRKTQTRRIVKTQHKNAAGFNVVSNKSGKIVGMIEYDEDERDYDNYMKPPYRSGDILYVREMWAEVETVYGVPYYIYKADDYNGLFSSASNFSRWYPSIHMPKKAARRFLRVKDVRVERLKDITCAGIEAEGIESERPLDRSERLCEYCPLPENCKGAHCYGGNPIMCEGSHCREALQMWEEEYKDEFAELWDSTIKKSDLPRYGWDANPWVWVIEFERIDKSGVRE